MVQEIQRLRPELHRVPLVDAKFFSAEMLKSIRCGDRISEGLELPKVNGAGAATTVVSNQCETLCSPADRFGSRSALPRIRGTKPARSQV